MDICLAAVEKAFQELGNDNAFHIHRIHPYFPSSKPETFFRPKIMGGFVPAFGVMALRVCPEFIQFPVIDGMRRQVKIASAPGNTYLGLIYLYSGETGELLAIIQDAYLQKLRVGATSAIAAKYLARPDSAILALFGTGWQAGAHLLAFSKIRALKKVRVFSPNREHCVSFAQEMSENLALEVVPVVSPREAVQDADIIVTATSSNEPVFKGEWLQEGVHVSSIVNSDEKRRRSELDAEVFRRSDLIVINSRDYLKTAKQKELLDLIDAGILSEEEIHELGELVTGKCPGRSDNKQITLYKNNVGMGIQFAAVGARILEESAKKGIGKEIPTEWFLQTRKGNATY
jgi:ornithine cyclodeaminase/alanine dehydrogenase-like protein (mu-crystallin family)